jgi:hypothetical protein
MARPTSKANLDPVTGAEASSDAAVQTVSPGPTMARPISKMNLDPADRKGRGGAEANSDLMFRAAQNLQAADKPKFKTARTVLDMVVKGRASGPSVMTTRTSRFAINTSNGPWPNPLPVSGTKNDGAAISGGAQELADLLKELLTAANALP